MTSYTSESQLLQKSIYSSLTHGERQYWLYLPKGYGEDDTKKWPVILFLHGHGERGEDLELVLKHGPIMEVATGRDLPFIIIAPQLPSRPESVPAVKRREGWPEDKRKPMGRETLGEQVTWGPLGPPNGWHESEKDLLLILDNVLRETRADPDRVYLTGLSYGGFGAWYMATHHPDRWAAVAPMCGAGEPGLVHHIGRTPVWLFQGGRDTLVLPEWPLKTADALDEAGGDVRVTVHEDLAHECWTRVYAGEDFYHWLLSHCRESPPKAQ
jgi:predicted peptidase